MTAHVCGCPPCCELSSTLWGPCVNTSHALTPSQVTGNSGLNELVCPYGPSAPASSITQVETEYMGFSLRPSWRCIGDTWGADGSSYPQTVWMWAGGRPQAAFQTHRSSAPDQWIYHKEGWGNTKLVSYLQRQGKVLEKPPRLWPKWPLPVSQASQHASLLGS